MDHRDGLGFGAGGRVGHGVQSCGRCHNLDRSDFVPVGDQADMRPNS